MELLKGIFLMLGSRAEGWKGVTWHSCSGLSNLVYVLVFTDSVAGLQTGGGYKN